MIKILWYSDFLLQTGFGNVAEEIVTQLLKTGKYEFTIIAINHEGDPYNEPNSPYYKFKNIPVYPARFEKDFMGRGRVIEFLRDREFDVFFSLLDPFNLLPMHESISTLKRGKKFAYVGYFPIDSDLKKSWTTSMKIADFPVLYTKYGLKQVQKHDRETAQRCSIIYHGADTSIFYPRSAEEREVLRKKFFYASDEDFILTNVNRNQPRKDPLRSIMVFAKVAETIPSAKLYLNMNIADPLGFDIAAFIQRYVPHLHHRILYPDPRKMWLIDKAMLGEIYAASDVVFSTSTGEGWGLSTTEAMASGVPVAMPDNTAFTEIIGNEERGCLAICNNFSILHQIDNGTMRPVVSVESLAHKISLIYKKPESAKFRADAALAWIKENCNWDEIGDQWNDIFQKAYELSKKQKAAL